MLLPVQTHGANRTTLHRIQHRRNRSHLILTQQQLKQSCKAFRIPSGLTQHIMELLQGAEEDLPKLVQDLGAAIISGFIHFSSQLLQTLLQLQLLQEIIQSQHLLGHILRIPEIILQLHQRQDRSFTGRVDGGKTLCRRFIKNTAETVRVECPVFLPAAATDAPHDGIVFHQIAHIRLHR